MAQQKYLGNYAGIVIQNNDPDKSGKVKIYVPHVSCSIYEGWKNVNEDRRIKFIGRNIDSDLSDIIEELKQILPWASAAMPIVGENSSGRYHNPTQTASISDTSYPDSFTPQDKKGELNLDSIGEAPAHLNQLHDFVENDEFFSSANGVNRANYLSYQYKPRKYSNSAKGLFGIPSVGSHVWVFFENGDPTTPVYFATSFGKDDWKSVYDEDYPSTFENKKNEIVEKDSADNTRYRSKFVINQKGGTVEVNNTDLKESISIAHASGSFKELNNHANIELAKKNDQKMVLGDQFVTIRGHQNIFVKRDVDENVRGDKYKKVGDINNGSFDQWKNIVAGIADIKQRFEIKRTKAITDHKYIKKTSLGQKQAGTFTKHPVTDGKTKYLTLENEWKEVGVPIVTDDTDGVSDYETEEPIGVQTIAEEKAFPSVDDYPFSLTGNKKGLSPSSQDGDWKIDKEKEKLEEVIKLQVKKLSELEAQMGLGGSEIIHIAKHKNETIGTVVNDFGSIRVDAVGKMGINEVLIDKFGVYENQKESPLIEYVNVDDLPGGTYNLTVGNKLNCIVGAGGIQLTTYGNMNIGGNIVNIGGEQINISSENEVNIHGDKKLTISSDILVLRQNKRRQVLIDSSLGITRNMIIAGGMHVEGELYIHHITAPLEMQQTEQTQLYARAVGSKQNRNKGDNIIGYIRPSDFQSTIDSFTSAKSHASTTSIIMDIPVRAIGDSGQRPDENSILCYNHSHLFANVPLKLMKGNNSVREEAKQLNDSERKASLPQDHSKKSTEVQ